MSELALTVYGHPEPAGSKRSFARPGGFARVVDANAKAAPWKAAVAAAAAEAWAGRELLDVALDVSMTVYRPRPRGHYGTGRNAGLLRPGAPAWLTGGPDAHKLAWAVEDGLAGIVHRDDALIVLERLEKRWGKPERIEVCLGRAQPEEALTRESTRPQNGEQNGAEQENGLAEVTVYLDRGGLGTGRRPEAGL